MIGNTVSLPLRPQITRQYKRPPHQGDAAWVVRRWLRVQSPGQRQTDGIAAFPGALDGNVRARPGQVFDRFAVNSNRETASGPRGTAQKKSEGSARAQRQFRRGRLTFGERSFHRQFQARVFPFDGGRRVKVDPESVACLIIDAVAVKRMVLHPRSHAARKTAEHILVFVPHIPPDRNHVAGSPIVGVNGSQHVVEQGALLKLGVPDVGRQSEQQPRHFENVVNVARLRCASVQMVADLIGREKVFILSVPARDKAVMAGDRVPEEARCLAVGLAARGDKARQRSEQLGNLRIAVLAGQNILAPRKRIDNDVVLEAVGKREPTFLRRIRVQVGQNFIHAAEFRIEHALGLRLVQT